MRVLTNEEITELLAPQPSGKPFVITSDGKKHTVQGTLPDAVVGSFRGNKGQPRKFTSGDPSIIAYKNKEQK